MPRKGKKPSRMVRFMIVVDFNEPVSFCRDVKPTLTKHELIIYAPHRETALGVATTFLENHGIKDWKSMDAFERGNVEPDGRIVLTPDQWARLHTDERRAPGS